jgi:hypothetical protein
MNLSSVPLRHEVGRNVLTNHRSRADHRHIPKPHELVDTGKTPDDNSITNNNVPG